MDIMELGAIGELVGGLAVVGSLLFVGLQVRQSNRISRAESVRAFVRDYNSLLYRLGENDELFRKGMADFRGLSKSEQTRLHVLFASNFFLGWGDSIIDPERADDFADLVDSSIALVVATPGMGQWWRHFRSGMVGLAADYVNRIDQTVSATGSVNILETMPWLAQEASDGEKV